MVCELDHEISGIVPRSYLTVTPVGIVAPHSYRGAGIGDLSFNKGEALLVLPGALPARGYWLARIGGKRGVVPRCGLNV